MILNKLKRLFAIYTDKERLRMFLEKTRKSDELKAKAYANRSTYVNCTTLRLNGESRPRGFVPLTQFGNYSPV